MESSTALAAIEDAALDELTRSMKTIESLFAEDALVLERVIGQLGRLDLELLSERERIEVGAELALQLESESSDDEFIAWSNLEWRLHRLKTITAVRKELRDASKHLEHHLLKTRRGRSLFVSRLKILQATTEKRMEDFEEHQQTSLLEIVNTSVQG